MIEINKVIIVVYRKNNKKIEFLGLKRTKDQGGYWQFLTGKIEDKELIKDAAYREISEEINIDKIKNLIITEKIFCFSNWKNQKSAEQLCIVELQKTVKITVSTEHDEYGWFEYSALQELLKFDNNKEALLIAYEWIISN